MGTQGVVSVVKGGKVVVKAIAGCNGMQAGRLAVFIRDVIYQDRPPTVYQMARQVRFGCADCLVVMGPKSVETRTQLSEDESSSPLYRRTFDDPQFNPRWERGTAEYVLVVDLDKRSIEVVSGDAEVRG